MTPNSISAGSHRTHLLSAKPGAVRTRLSLRVRLLPIALAASFVIACGGGGEEAAAPSATPKADPNVLTASKQVPASLATDDPAWAAAPILSAQMEIIKGTKQTEAVVVEAQALYSETDVWFRFQWPDATQDIGRPWQYDGTKWALSSRKSDRIGLLWPIGTVGRFEQRGCYAACHRDTADADKSTPIDDKAYMILPRPEDKADNWQWTGESSAPVNQVGDFWFAGVLSNPDSKSSAIRSDEGAGGTTNNAVAAPGVGPAKMQDPAKKPTYGASYITPADAIPLDITKFKAGDSVPRRFVTPWTGSKGDIKSSATYAAGKWTVVFNRKLDTGNADDVKFVPGQSYLFQIAVWNGDDHAEHTVAADVYTLTMK